eukprot:superscaffoldBa00001377_g10294
MGLAVTTTTVRELDSTVPCLDVTVAQTADHWTLLGAKPKALVSSPPSQKEPGTAACKAKRGRKLPFRPHPPQDVQLTNKFSILDEQDFPPLTGHWIPPSSPESDGSLSPPPLLPRLCPSSPTLPLTVALNNTPPSSQSSGMQFTPHPVQASMPERAHTQQLTPFQEDMEPSPDLLQWSIPPPGVSSPGPAPPRHRNLTQHFRGLHRAPESSKSSSQPTTLILGDSIIKNFRVGSFHLKGRSFLYSRKMTQLKVVT